MHADQINSFFELFGGVFVFLNIQQLCKHKKVRGVSITGTVFFVVWGFWNLYYYPSLGQMWSFYGGLVVTIFNTLWIILALYFSWKEKHQYSHQVNTA